MGTGSPRFDAYIGSNLCDSDRNNDATQAEPVSAFFGTN